MSAKLNIIDFGKHLLESGDLDPVYIMLVKAELEPKQLARWLVAYWCFYHCGVASYMSEFEGDAYWSAMRVAAINEQPAPNGGRWPRGHERRHFRGDNAIKALDSLQQSFGDNPERFVEDLVFRAEHSQGDFKVVASEVRKQHGFGPWMAFKVADMIDRVLGIPVNFDKAAVFMFDDPVEAALMLWRNHNGFGDNVKPKDKTAVIEGVVQHLNMAFKDYSAPPHYDRMVNLQEIETILCKWKSHMNGHYPLNNDIIEIAKGLDEWSGVKTAKLLQHCLPKAA